jgi:hypothetical protein
MHSFNKSVVCIVGLGLIAMPLLRDSARADAAQGRFDGIWDTRLSCSNSNGALGYSFEFDSIVKNNVLHGEKGTQNQPGWLQLDGSIAADGAARIYAKGQVGAAPFAVGQRPAGTEYGYNIEAKFSAASGSGHRVEGRPCTVEFKKQT